MPVFWSGCGFRYFKTFYADYEVLDNSGIDGPKRSRLRREQGRPLLFDKFEFCLSGNDYNSSFITKEKLRALLMTCGGSVVRSVAHMSFARGVVCLAIVDKECAKFHSRFHDSNFYELQYIRGG